MDKAKLIRIIQNRMLLIGGKASLSEIRQRKVSRIWIQHALSGYPSAVLIQAAALYR